MAKLPPAVPTWPQAIAACLLWVLYGAAQAQSPEDVRFATVCIEPDMNCSSITRIVRLTDAWEIPAQSAVALDIQTETALRIPLDEARWDDATLTLYWRRPLDDRARQPLMPSRAPDLPPPLKQPLSAVLRYSAFASTHADPIVGADLVVARGNTHLQASAIATGSQITRGLASIQHRQPEHARKWILGESLASSTDPLGGAAVFKGLTVARDFSLQPGFDPRPRPGVSGLIDQPGVIEVYRNGALVRSTPVQPGPYEWGATGAGSGAQQLQFVFKAADGSTRVLSRQGFYGQPTALAQGVSDYSASVGQTRSGERAWQGYYRRGLHPRLTMGARTEGEGSRRNHGVNAQISVSTMAFDVSAARDNVGNTAWSASATGGWGPVDVYASRRRFDDGYWKLGDDDVLDLGPAVRLVSEDALGAGWSGRNSSINLQHGRRQFEDGQVIRESSVQASFQQANRWRWSLGATRQEGAFSDRSVGLSLSVPIGARVMASSRVQEGSNPYVSLDASRTPSSRFEWSGSASVLKPLDDQPDVASARVSRPTHRGTASLDAFSIGSNASATAGWAGSIVAVDGRVGLSSAYPGGFAWVSAPETPEAIVLYNNQPLGKIGTRGVIVDNLPANTPVQVKLDPASLPLQSYLSTSTIRFVSSGLGVATIEFSPVRSNAMTLQVVGPQGPVSLGTLELSDGTRLLVGSTGNVWVQGSLPNDKSATWHGDGGPLSCTVDATTGVSCVPPLTP